MGRRIYLGFVACALAGLGILALLPHAELTLPGAALALLAVGAIDRMQAGDAIRRNFPVIGSVRALWEALGPVLEPFRGDARDVPFSRSEQRLIVARSEGRSSLVSFGTAPQGSGRGRLSVRQALYPGDPAGIPTHVDVGGPGCAKPYRASLLNVSALSFGALSDNALQALGEGARAGGFFLNTGEGGLAPVFLRSGADLVWQIGTAYFGCRTPEGAFCPERFARQAQNEAVRMVEVKLSQGAKPGHGAILAANKVTREVAEVCGIPPGVDSLCPAAHSAFDGPESLCRFLARLRALSGGKPVGIKLCLGRRGDFLAICKAMLETGILPDFISVDGAEGGAGAAPYEFAEHVGTPLEEALWFVDNALRGIGVRHHVRVIASGRIATGFGMVHALAMGAELCASARAFMLALGCIQALQCAANTCPTGVATQDPRLTRGLVVRHKRERVARFQSATLESARELLAAMGLRSPRDLRPEHIERQHASGRSASLDLEYPALARGALLRTPLPDGFTEFAHATTNRFLPSPPERPRVEERVVTAGRSPVTPPSSAG